MSMELMQVNQMQEMAKAVAASRLWKCADTPEKALGLMLLCQSEGLHPMTAVRRYDLIQGTPTLKSEAQLAEFYKRGGVVKWIKRDETECHAKFSHPKHCPDGVEIRWTIEMAKKANLTGKDNWKNYPRQMLSARVQAEGVQVVDPGAGLGMLTPEEAMDVNNGLADYAADAAASLTGQDRQELSELPEVTLTDAEAKKARAELNQALLKCASVHEFRDACLTFQNKYTKGIWVKQTAHSKSYADNGNLTPETFALLAKDHQNRVEADAFRQSPEGQHQWRQDLEKCTPEGFATFQESYNQNEFRQIQENSDALSVRGRELGIEEYLIEGDPA